MTRHPAALLALSSLALAVLFACTSGGPGTASARSGSGARPDWVRGAPSEMSDYAPSEYVTGVGSGSDDASARQSARAEISRVFQSRVEADFRSRTAATIVEASGQTGSRVIEQLDIDTQVTSTGTFDGIKIAEVWHDASAGTYYALATLDKAKTRQVLLEQLRSAADRTHGALVRSDNAPTYLGRGRALIDAVRASGEVDAIVSRARLVGRPSVMGLPGTGSIERDLGQTLQDTRFQIRAVEIDAASGAERGGLPKLQEELSKMITEIGFKVVEPGSSAGSPNVWLECRMSLQQIDRGLDTYFVRWEGAFELEGPPPSGAVILSSKDSGGESFSTPELARTRAVMKGSAKLSRELKSQIARYLSDSSGH